MFRMEPDETLADALLRVARLSPAARREAAVAGRGAAEQLNEATLRRWQDLLTQLAGQSGSAGRRQMKRAS
jgi:hypothetical protein